MFEGWPMKIRNEAQRYWPRGEQSLAAIQWTAVFAIAQERLAPAGALLVTERELVVIAEEKEFLSEPPPETPSAEESKAILGGVTTFVPPVRLKDFHVSHQERCGLLVLQVQAAHGVEELKLIFPSDDEMAVSKAMEQMLVSTGPAK